MVGARMKILNTASTVLVSLCCSLLVLGEASSSSALAATTTTTENKQNSIAPSDQLVLATPKTDVSTSGGNDPNLWLENVEGKDALDWVRKENAISTRELEATPDFAPIESKLLKILDSKDRIPFVSKHGKYYYNFWRDGKNPRGLYRRTTLEEYRKPQPNWETIIDLDQLAKDENENWVWSGSGVLYPDNDRTLIRLSRGGADATVVREFDLTAKQFVKDGFNLPEAKNEVNWRDRNALYVATDFGPGSMTSSGYPRIVKEWKRSTPLSDASTVAEGKVSDVDTSAYVAHDHGRIYELLNRRLTFFSDEISIKSGDSWVKIDKPVDSELRTYDGNILLELRSDWNIGEHTYKAGSLLSENFDDYLKGARKFSLLFEPTSTKSLLTVGDTKDYLIITELDNVRSRPYAFKHEASGSWSRTAIEVPEFSEANIQCIAPNESDDYFLTASNFITPTTLSLGVAGKPGSEKLKSLPNLFNSINLKIEQHFVKSKDGTQVPYFQVSQSDLKMDGSSPTLLNGYGGFEVSMQPTYGAIVGAGWLERGGVFVLANIRGGGEFGPSWHNAARKENRQRAYDDFIAIAEDLIARKVTSPKHLGIEGRSNGGLLMGVMLTQRPDLFGAIHCGSPLLDMRRFSKLLAGASWMDEYGDPDQPEQWAYISKYSPYQNIDAKKKYPPILVTTSTRDDRVHPGHARKMVARLLETGHQTLYYENIEGGHGVAANNNQRAFMEALIYSFLWKELRNTESPKAYTERDVQIKVVDALDSADLAAYTSDMERRLRTSWLPRESEVDNTPAVVGIYVDSRGNLIDTKLVHSSGVRSFDRLAVQAVQNAQPYSPIPVGAKLDQLQIVVTFTEKKMETVESALPVRRN
jgi:prolyl oligopeptidase